MNSYGPVTVAVDVPVYQYTLLQIYGGMHVEVLNVALNGYHRGDILRRANDIVLPMGVVHWAVIHFFFKYVYFGSIGTPCNE